MKQDSKETGKKLRRQGLVQPPRRTKQPKLAKRFNAASRGEAGKQAGEPNRLPSPTSSAAELDAGMLSLSAEACGWALARAHAKAGDALTLTGQLGSNDPFDEALGDFGLAYADQTEGDHTALKAAVRAGKIEAYAE